ncbi:hypothetical protein BT93_I0402 [Corymbia citriodora subsp. variegata]|nr:hypothetical protein BT93_I0402 [Corymbia citriodora subsp. variegata]
MGRAFGFLCTVASLGSASVQLGYVRAQGGPSHGLNSTQGALGNGNGAQYGLYSNLDPTMAIVVVVTICAFFMMGFFSVYLRHCSEEPSGRPGGSRSGAVRFVGVGGGNYRRGLDPGVVGSFPVLAYVAVKDHKLGKGALECAVCLAEFDDFDELKILPKCEHAFHPECIDAWLASHVTCPVCRANQTPDPCLRHVDAAVAAAAAAAAESAVDRSRMSQPYAEEEEGEGHQPGRRQQLARDEVRNEVRIDIGGGGSEELGAVATAAAAGGKLPKSHSTGHLLARPGPDPDRYALRLPEEVRRQIRMAGMKRATSYDVLLAAIEGSSWKGGGGRLFAAAAAATPPSPILSKADRICGGDGTDGGDREFEVGEQSLSRLPV